MHLLFISLNWLFRMLNLYLDKRIDNKYNKISDKQTNKYVTSNTGYIMAMERLNWSLKSLKEILKSFSLPYVISLFQVNSYKNCFKSLKCIISRIEF